MRLKSHANTSTKNNPVIIIAHSARTLAESATRAGYSVITIDGFADLDTVAVSCESWCLPLVEAGFDACQLETCLQKVHARHPLARVIAGAGCEPFINYIASISGWQMLGNSVACIQQIAAPNSFFAALEQLSIPYPTVRFDPPEEHEQEWLYKIPGRCGGMGVRAHSREANPRGYWQQECDGVSISALFLCDHRQTQLIGINRQFSCALLPQLPYVYCGALANYNVREEIRLKIDSYINKLSEHFNLVGLCSIDMILINSDLFVLEINPRVSATYSLYEQLQPSTNLIDAHIRVCEGERLSRLDPALGQCAYAIVFADQDYIVPQLDWPQWVSDRPEAGRRIHKYEPVCSVYALFEEAEDLYNMTQKKEQQVLSLIKQ